MLKRCALVALLLAAALALAACGGDGEDEDGPPAAPTAPAGVTPAATPAPATPPAADDDLDDFDAFELVEGESIFGVAGVSSFRQRWSMTFGGPGAVGTGMAGTTEILTEMVLDPPAVRVQMGGPDGTVMLETIRIGDDAWIGGAGQPWQHIPAGSVPFSPDDLMALTGTFMVPEGIADLGLFTRVGREAVHGRQTIHYTLDARDIFALLQRSDPQLADAELTEGRFDYWIDESAGFIVRFVIVMEGTGLDIGFDDFDEPGDDPVRMEMVFELFDFDANITIEPPQ